MATLRAVDNAPTGEMFDHYHKEGERMISERQSHIEMSGNIFNGNAISAANVMLMPNSLSSQLATHPIVPEKINMNMTMM